MGADLVASVAAGAAPERVIVWPCAWPARLTDVRLCELSALPARIFIHRPGCSVVAQSAWPEFRRDCGVAS
jgi:hypothetical protein